MGSLSDYHWYVKKALGMEDGKSFDQYSLKGRSLFIAINCVYINVACLFMNEC